jgi:hypothetical protein
MLLKEMIAAQGKRYEAVLKKGGHDSLHITFFDDSMVAKILLFRLWPGLCGSATANCAEAIYDRQDYLRARDLKSARRFVRRLAQDAPEA